MDALALVLALFLVIVNAFFVAAEFAIVKVRPTRIEELVRAGKPSARMVQRILSNIDAYLSACQLGITMASLALGRIGEPAFHNLLSPIIAPLGSTWLANWLSEIASFMAFFILTFLHITAGEQAPKSLALVRAEPLALAIAYPLRLVYILLFPFIWLINSFSLWMVRATGTRVHGDRDEAPSVEELKLIVAKARSAGLVSVSRSEVMRKAMSLPAKTAKHLMVPRSEVAFLDINQSLQENLERARHASHTRFPLVDRELDDVLGIIDIRRVGRHCRSRDHGDTAGVLPRANVG